LGIKTWRANGAMLGLQYYLALKAEALYLTDRTSEALEARKSGRNIERERGI
jgi:hypothetical protein